VKYNPEKHHRRSLRLKGYDYSSPGAYFITICTHQRECLFGEIVDGEMQLNELGQIAAHEWARSADIRQEIEFDAWVVMPNHIHGIVMINAIDRDADDVNRANCHSPLPVRANCHSPVQVGANGNSPMHSPMHPPMKMKSCSLSSFVTGFKSATTKQINIHRNTWKIPVWQRNYYEHIIRNEEALQHIRRYVHNNPIVWQQDQLHPDNLSKW
jgi:putative transposase